MGATIYGTINRHIHHLHDHRSRNTDGLQVQRIGVLCSQRMYERAAVVAVVMVFLSTVSVFGQTATPQPVEVTNWPTAAPTASPTATVPATATPTPLPVTIDANGCANPGPTPTEWDGSAVAARNSYQACQVADVAARMMAVGVFFAPLLLVAVVGGFTLAKKA